LQFDDFAKFDRTTPRWTLKHVAYTVHAHQMTTHTPIPTRRCLWKASSLH